MSLSLGNIVFFQNQAGGINDDIADNGLYVNHDNPTPKIYMGGHLVEDTEIQMQGFFFNMWTEGPQLYLDPTVPSVSLNTYGFGLVSYRDNTPHMTLGYPNVFLDQWLSLNADSDGSPATSLGLDQNNNLFFASSANNWNTYTQIWGVTKQGDFSGGNYYRQDHAKMVVFGDAYPFVDTAIQAMLGVVDTGVYYDMRIRKSAGGVYAFQLCSNTGATQTYLNVPLNGSAWTIGRLANSFGADGITAQTGLVLDTTQYLAVRIGGTNYKVALVN